MNIEKCTICNHAVLAGKDCNHAHYIKEGVGFYNDYKKRVATIKQEVKCPTCNKMFLPTKERSVYCSGDCHWFIYRNRPKEVINSDSDVSIA